MSSLTARSAGRAATGPYRVMVVDDSAIIRGFFRRAMESDPEIDIVASVGNGQSALDSLNREPVDVIVLDIEMPVMDGMTALPKLLEIDSSVKIIMASTLTLANADVSLKALSMGATDYIPKPTSNAEMHSTDAFKLDLIEKVKALGRARRGLPATAGPVATAPKKGAPPIVAASAPLQLRRPSMVPPTILAIGSSTGGPQALLKVVEGLGSDFALPILITQHMPATFTGILAEHLGKACGREAKEGQDGERIRAGCIYVAPGDYHMVIEGNEADAVIRLTQTPPENFCRPSVDPMLRSLVSIFGNKLYTVILTGMGHDGLDGSRAAAEAGGTVIAQDEETSIVWGMPGAVANDGICSAVLPLGNVAAKVLKACGRTVA